MPRAVTNRHFPMLEHMLRQHFGIELDYDPSLDALAGSPAGTCSPAPERTRKAGSAYCSSTAPRTCPGAGSGTGTSSGATWAG